MKQLKHHNRILSFLTIICCLAGSLLPVYRSGASEMSDVPRVTFTNEPKSAPDLYIKKELENAESYTGKIPEFSFLLKLNGSIPNRQEYTIIDESGNEKTDKDGNKQVFYAENGSFTLSPNETAWFKNVGVGTKYEVIEDETAFFTQVEPAKGTSVKGTVPYEGVQRLFRNRYEPIIPGETTTLTICKTVSFPEGYTAPETPDFTFKVTLDNEAYGNESYAVINNETGKVVESGITEEDGTFQMKGGYTASFADIPTNMEYRVEEIEVPTGWRVTGDDVLEGEKTRAPETALYFNNTNTSFYVTKEMKSGEDIPEEPFEFQLMKEDEGSQYEWAGAEYYVYDISTGKKAEDDLQKTTDKGRFTLKAGQAAIFVNVEPGTFYSVSEIANPDYKQETPNNATGYVNYEATDSIEELPFVNTAQKKNGMLTVTKRVEGLKGEVVGNENQEKDQFYFELYQVTDGTPKDIPMAGETYSIAKGKDTETHDTDENGRFSIKANETAVFEGVPLGEYKVKEVELAEGYKIKPDSEGKVDQQGVLKTTDNLDFIFMNEYLADKVNLELTKVNRVGDKTFSNISFELRKDEEVGEVIGTYTTGNDRKLLIQDLASGVYYLKELEAPMGYQVLEAPIRIEITRSQDRREIQVEATVDGIGLEVDDKNSSKEEETNNDIARKVTKLELVKNDTEADQIKISVINDLLYSLPNSGGSGIFLYILSGIVLMMAASYLYWKKVRLRQI